MADLLLGAIFYRILEVDKDGIDLVCSVDPPVARVQVLARGLMSVMAERPTSNGRANRPSCRWSPCLCAQPGRALLFKSAFALSNHAHYGRIQPSQRFAPRVTRGANGG